MTKTRANKPAAKPVRAKKTVKFARQANEASDAEEDISSEYSEPDDEIEPVEEIPDDPHDEEDEVIDKARDYDDDEAKPDDNEGGDDADKTERDTCLYKFGKDNESDEEDLEDDTQIEDDIEIPVKSIKNTERITKPVLTKYERVRILGERAKQISLGAKPMLLGIENMNPKDIARLELERGVMPLIIEKPLPDGTVDQWRVSELRIQN